MQKIGQISVPDNLWLRIVEYSALQFIDVALDHAEYELSIDLGRIRDELCSEIPQQIVHLVSCIIALIRIQTDDYVTSDSEIESSKQYLEIWRAAESLADQICYKALPADSKLKTIVNDNWHNIANRPA